MQNSLVGCWKLQVWKRVPQGGDVTFPLGEDAEGLLIYTADGRMAVQLVAADRPQIDTQDSLQGGSVEQRAEAYSTCLAYFGGYEIQGDHVVHQVEASLFPDWSGQQQIRPFMLDGDTLILHTPPVHLAGGDVTNELIWVRAGSQADSAGS